jgi:surface antigen/peptidoglycan hydrolase CwlO-like protein
MVKRTRLSKVLDIKPDVINWKFGVIVLVAVLSVGIFGAKKYIGAQSLQEQINDLSDQNNQTQAQVDALKVEASSYQETINALAAQINAYQREINQRQAESEQLKVQIAEKEIELTKQKGVLGDNIKSMYLEGDISTVEMLATSKDLSDYLDKQQYREVTSNSMKATLDKVTALKAELQTKNDEVQRIIKEQEQLKVAADTQKAEQDRLLGFNQSQQSEFNNQIKNNQSKIADLKRQQAIENARLFGGGGGMLGGGGYPWGRAPCFHTGQVEGSCPNYDWSVNGSIWNWNLSGYGYRNCTDWVAYRVEVAGGHVPGGLGHAKLWDDRAPSYGLTVSSVARVGAAAVSNNGYYGHVMYVEAVNSDGTIVVSDYNRAGTGKYDTNTLSASTAANLRYVYF